MLAKKKREAMSIPFFFLFLFTRLSRLAGCAFLVGLQRISFPVSGLPRNIDGKEEKRA